jgi:N-acetylglutamate synthase-like GNAT family acetyltransferase
MSNVTIEPLTSGQDIDAFGDLLWEVLWKPLELPRDIGDSFKLDGEKIEFAATENGNMVGGLVANWTTPKEVELRHLAVRPGAANRRVGTRLVEALLQAVKVRGCTRVHTIARNTSAGFFRKLGFTTAPGTPPEHPHFKKHGISFELLEKEIT